MREIANILKISKSIKLLVKMKNVPFILQEKLNRLLANPVCRRTKSLKSGREKTTATEAVIRGQNGVSGIVKSSYISGISSW